MPAAAREGDEVPEEGSTEGEGDEEGEFDGLSAFPSFFFSFSSAVLGFSAASAIFCGKMVRFQGVWWALLHVNEAIIIKVNGVSK